MRSILAHMPTEKIILHKKHGAAIEDITALVQPNMIAIDDSSIIIEEDDVFERILTNGAKEFYLVVDRGFFKGMAGISDHYQSKVKKITEREMLELQLEAQQDYSRPHKLFISHSSKDKDYIVPFVELLEDIGMPDGSIVCTSTPGHGIPGGAKIYDWLREQFLKCDLRVVFALSQNYYDSPASLNEMGAAWVTKTTDTLLLLPGFGFGDIRGCLDPTKVGIKLDSDEDELKHRLNELKDTIVEEYGLPQLTETRWERHRDAFIQKIKDVQPTDSESEGISLPQMTRNDPSDHQMLAEACVMLLYAAEGNGEIIVSKTMSGTTTYSVSGQYNMNANQSPREIAKWDEAIETLVNKGYIKLKNHNKNTAIYVVTQSGYINSDAFKETNSIDTSKTPQAVISWLYEE